MLGCKCVVLFSFHFLFLLQGTKITVSRKKPDIFFKNSITHLLVAQGTFYFETQNAN